jgi:hypothetical protein
MPNFKRRLSEDVRAMKATADRSATDIGNIQVNLATLTENVRHLPTKGWGVTVIITLAAFLTAMTLFGPKLLKLVGQ